MKNLNYEVERRLLQRCAVGDVKAQRDFSLHSYLGRVYRTAHETNLQFNKPLTTDEVESLSAVLAFEIYNAWKTLPHPRRPLHDQISLYVFRAVTEYIKERYS